MLNRDLDMMVFYESHIDEGYHFIKNEANNLLVLKYCVFFSVCIFESKYTILKTLIIFV